MKLHPKMAFTFVESGPDDVIYELCIKLKNVRGALAKTAAVISEMGVNIRTSTLFESPENSKEGFWTLFIDASKMSTSIQELADRLRQLDVVLDVEVKKPYPVPYDVMHFPLMHGDLRAIVMSTELFKSLFEEIEKILTPSGFAAVFYNAGKKSGETYAEYFKEKFKVKTKEEMLALLSQASQAIGWGIPETYTLDIEEGRGSIRVLENIEAIIRSKRAEATCHWTRGFIAGYIGKVLGEPIEASETKCLAIGDKYCEFELRVKRKT